MSRVVAIVPRPDHYDHHTLACGLYDLMNPTRLYDQYFGMGLSEGELLYPAMVSRAGPSRHRLANGLSEVTRHANKFQVHLDVNQFTLEELSVKVLDDCVVIHGKHDERSDEHGFVAREFTRRYDLPEGVQLDKMVSMLTRSGVLTVEAPVKAPGAIASAEMVVPICQEGSLVVPEVQAVPTGQEGSPALPALPASPEVLQAVPRSPEVSDDQTPTTTI